MNYDGTDATRWDVEMPNGSRLIGIDTMNSRLLKVIPLVGTKQSKEPITLLSVESDDTNVMSASVTDNGLMSIKAKSKGTVHVTITARNEQSGHYATATLRFKVAETSDVVDVITGTGEDSYGTLRLEGKLLESVSFKIKDYYKNILEITEGGGHGSGYEDLQITESNGVFTVTNFRLGSTNPQQYFQVKNIYGGQLGGVSTIFYPDAEAKYPLTSVDKTVTAYYGDPKRDGEMLAIDSSWIGGNNIQAAFAINPGVLRNAASVVTEVTSSDTEVAVVTDEVNYLNNMRQIPIRIVGVGTTQITLHVTDGLEYDETATITVVVTE